MQACVVEVSRPRDGVACISFQDRETKNLFSTTLIREITAAFAELGADESCKVILLTGYGNYFLSGGTQEALLQLHETDASFADSKLYSLALECPIPVIAAMQGHAIGGGFVLGISADIVVLARESLYTANFMQFGFTPGMGATCILPEKLGLPLAQEMLLSAVGMRGEELRQRGVPFAVLPRRQVLLHAMNLAAELADKPRTALAFLKWHLSTRVRDGVAAIVQQEEAMHRATIHHPDVRDRIMRRFAQS